MPVPQGEALPLQPFYYSDVCLHRPAALSADSPGVLSIPLYRLVMKDCNERLWICCLGQLGLRLSWPGLGRSGIFAD